MRKLLRLALGILGTLAASAPVAAQPEGPLFDRAAVRLVSPETGGVARPRFFSEREVAFYTRIEAQLEQSPLEAGDYPERYVRSAVDRLVARTMLASLLVQRGFEPTELEKQVGEAREELEARLGGPQVLTATMKKEGIEDEELQGFLRDEVRAEIYVDRTISPILAVTEDALRETYRSTIHPFRGSKFDDVRLKLRRWLVTERERAAELEFLQAARARIKVTTIPGPSP